MGRLLRRETFLHYILPSFVLVRRRVRVVFRCVYRGCQQDPEGGHHGLNYRTAALSRNLGKGDRNPELYSLTAGYDRLGLNERELEDLVDKWRRTSRLLRILPWALRHTGRQCAK